MPSPPLQHPPLPPLQIHTYHCLCTTHLLTTPYPLSSLPHRSAPALDNAAILPLPPLSAPTTATSIFALNTGEEEEDKTSEHDPHLPPNPITTNDTAAAAAAAHINLPNEELKKNAKEKQKQKILPSLLSPSLRLSRKMVVVRREDGFEKRRVWRCGRCGVGVGYEVVGAGEGGEKEKEKEGDGERVVFLLEVGLREMG